MFIKIITANKQFKTVGEIVDADDAKAQFLIDEGFAEKTEAPASIKTVDTELTALVGAAVDAAATKTIEAIRKEIAPTQKRLNHLEEKTEAFVLPSNVRKYGSMRNFPNTEEGTKRAYRMGMWFLANYAKNCRDPERHEAMQPYIAKAKSLGINMKAVREDEHTDMAVTKAVGGGLIDTKAASTELNNQSSGFLVPDEFQNDLIDLREKYGVARQHCKIVPMASDTRTDPRRRGGATATFVGESTSGTQTNKNWDRVRLVAKKLMFLAKYSNELNEDAVLSIADDLAGEAAWAFAAKEDACLFAGDGSSTYGGITGVPAALTNLTATLTNILGLTFGAAGTGTSYAGFTLANFNNMVASLPQFADGNAKWFCHRFVWAGVMQRLQTAAGGNTIVNLAEGARNPMFLGYPVVITQQLPKTAATSQVVCLFGDMAMCASLGDRRHFTIALSDAALNAFEQDEMAMRATERFDINVHDVGEITGGTARDTVMGLVAGPVVGLATATT